MSYLKVPRSISISCRYFSAPTIPHAKYYPAMTKEMLPKDTFKDKVAFVTGGGTGLGKAMSINLAKLGASVLISSRKSDVLEKAVSEIKSVSGSEKVGFAPCDVRDIAAVSSAVDACKSQFGANPNIVVNNAAGNFISPTKKLSPNAINAVVDIVLKGTVNVTLETSKRLISEQRGGACLSISTIYAQTGSAYVVPSAIAKSGVETLMKSLAAEWGRYGLRFNAIAPGPIYTKGAFSRLDPTGRFQKVLTKRIPAGRLGEKEELANLCSYLVSDYSSWITGEVVKFDGGELANISGEFNILTEMVSDSDWDLFEKMIKSQS